MSIGILGFIVWSYILMASPYSDIRNIINFAICWDSLVLISTLYGKNLISYTQSADNLSLNKQSVSETTCERSFYAFHAYYTILFKNKDYISNEWLTWFIGFSEGDGVIQTCDNMRFVITKKERDILDKIQSKLNIGVVKHFPNCSNEGFYKWIVDDYSHILLLALLFNGNLALNPKIHQLALWVKALNNRYGCNTIKLNNTPFLITLQDGWLSGFTDANGCFNVSITRDFRYKLGFVIKMRYILDKKEDVILKRVYELFGFGKVTLRSGTGNVYRYTATGFKALKDVIRYFKLFPLQTNKCFSFEKWKIVHSQVSKKLHLTHKGLTQIRTLKNQINLNNSKTNKIGQAGVRKLR